MKKHLFNVEIRDGIQYINAHYIASIKVMTTGSGDENDFVEIIMSSGRSVKLYGRPAMQFVIKYHEYINGE